MKKPEENYHRICPKCGSTDLELNIDFFNQGGGNFGRMTCKNCGYGYPDRGIFPEVPADYKFKKK